MNTDLRQNKNSPLHPFTGFYPFDCPKTVFIPVHVFAGLANRHSLHVPKKFSNGDQTHSQNTLVPSSLSSYPHLRMIPSPMAESQSHADLPIRMAIFGNHTPVLIARNRSPSPSAFWYTHTREHLQADTQKISMILFECEFRISLLPDSITSSLPAPFLPCIIFRT